MSGRLLGLLQEGACPPARNGRGPRGQQLSKNDRRQFQDQPAHPGRLGAKKLSPTTRPLWHTADTSSVVPRPSGPHHRTRWPSSNGMHGPLHWNSHHQQVTATRMAADCQFRLYLKILLETGARPEEALALTWFDCRIDSDTPVSCFTLKRPHTVASPPAGYKFPTSYPGAYARGGGRGA
ncbi:hypothetical protein DFAR_200017 [Desulfarculales bacterium]